MEILNPGNALPVYPNLQSQMHNRCGCEWFDWAIPVALGEWLTFEIPVASGTAGQWDWALEQVGEISSTSLDAALLNYSETQDGEAWVAYHGDDPMIPRDCGVFWFEIFNNTTGARYYTERFRVIDFTGNTSKIYKLTFRNTTDIDGILYQGGYEQKVWLMNAVFDTPEIREATENITDGNAVEVLAFHSVQRREVLRFPYVPDFWQGVFHRLRMHDDVSLEKLDTGEVFALTGIEFSTDEQDICFSRGALSWHGSTQIMTGCEENKAMVYLNNGVVG